MKKKQWQCGALQIISTNWNSTPRRDVSSQSLNPEMQSYKPSVCVVLLCYAGLQSFTRDPHYHNTLWRQQTFFLQTRFINYLKPAFIITFVRWCNFLVEFCLVSYVFLFNELILFALFSWVGLYRCKKIFSRAYIIILTTMLHISIHLF